MLSSSQDPTAHAQSMKTLDKLRHKLNGLRPFEEDDEQKRNVFERLCVQITSYLSFMGSRPQVPHDEWIRIEPVLLEPESSIMLKTSKRVFDTLVVDSENTTGSFSGDAFDMSAWVISLTKLFENEISLSVTHWFRNELGIEMPKFFNRYQPGKKAIFHLEQKKHKPKAINFNRSNKSHWWQPPTLGDTYYSFVKKNPDVILPSLYGNDISILKSKWAEVLDIRNKCAHSELLDKDFAFKIIDDLNELADNKIFEKLNELKCKFREKE
jgi:hypothetical protein